MFRFIKEHWLPYLIGAALAIILGFSAAFFVGVVGSTPDDVMEDQVQSEEDREASTESMQESLEPEASDEAPTE